MDYVNLFVTFALTSVVTSIVIFIMIISWLQQRKQNINFVLIKLFVPKYVEQYKRISREESGKVGPLYVPWLVTINLTWFFAIAAFVMNRFV